MRGTYAPQHTKNPGKTKQENAGDNFWMPTAKSDHGGHASWPSEEGKPARIGPAITAEQWGDKREYTMKKNGEKTKQENSGKDFLGTWRHQWPNQTMATAHHGI